MKCGKNFPNKYGLKTYRLANQAPNYKNNKRQVFIFPPTFWYLFLKIHYQYYW